MGQEEWRLRDRVIVALVFGVPGALCTWAAWSLWGRADVVSWWFAVPSALLSGALLYAGYGLGRQSVRELFNGTGPPPRSTSE